MRRNIWTKALEVPETSGAMMIGGDGMASADNCQCWRS